MTGGGGVLLQTDLVSADERPYRPYPISLAGNRRSRVKHRHCPGFDVAGLVAATRVSLPLTNTFMEFSVSPDSSVYS